MAARVLLTVDTELTWRHFARGACWRENFALSCEPAGVGIRYQLDTLRRHGLKGCFFVDPMPALVYGIEPVRRMVAPILAAGQEVQLHLHSCWRSLAEGGDEAAGFELTDFNEDEQRALIQTARDLLVEAGAPRPIAFRSGSYAANEATLSALRLLGIRYDSSHNGGHHPWPSALPLDAAQVAPLDLGGVIEVPISQIEDSPGHLRHLQLCAVSSGELHAALRHADASDHPLVTIVSHSFELATRDGRRPNGLVQRRFERLCAFLAGSAESLPTVHFSDLGGIRLAGDAKPLRSNQWRKARRLAEQIWSGARYERPGEAATAAYGASVSGVQWLMPLLGA